MMAIEPTTKVSARIFRLFLDLCMVTDPWPLTDDDNSTFSDWLNHQAQLYGYPSWVEAYHQFKVSTALECELFRESRLFRATIQDVPASQPVTQQDVTMAIAQLLVTIGHGDLVGVGAYMDLTMRLVARWSATRIARGQNVVSQIKAFEDELRTTPDEGARVSDVKGSASLAYYTSLEQESRGAHKLPPMPQGMTLRCTRCRKTPAELPEYAGPAAEAGMTPEQYCWEEEGTLNRESGNFLCTSDYVAAGMPSTPGGWQAP